MLVYENKSTKQVNSDVMKKDIGRQNYHNPACKSTKPTTVK